MTQSLAIKVIAKSASQLAGLHLLSSSHLILDKDGDGKVSRDEFASLVFDRADTNHDGVIDAKELAALRARQ